MNTSASASLEREWLVLAQPIASTRPVYRQSHSKSAHSMAGTPRHIALPKASYSTRGRTFLHQICAFGGAVRRRRGEYDGAGQR